MGTASKLAVLTTALDSHTTVAATTTKTRTDQLLQLFRAALTCKHQGSSSKYQTATGQGYKYRLATKPRIR